MFNYLNDTSDHSSPSIGQWTLLNLVWILDVGVETGFNTFLNSLSIDVVMLSLNAVS